ncbi:unnamed protein product, partial [Choristocarpus tenellus]
MRLTLCLALGLVELAAGFSYSSHGCRNTLSRDTPPRLGHVGYSSAYRELLQAARTEPRRCIEENDGTQPEVRGTNQFGVVGELGRTVVSAFLTLAIIGSTSVTPQPAAAVVDDEVYVQLERRLQVEEVKTIYKKSEGVGGSVATSSSPQQAQVFPLDNVGSKQKPPRQRRERPEIPAGRITIVQLFSRINIFQSAPTPVWEKLPSRRKPPSQEDLPPSVKRALSGSLSDAITGREPGQRPSGADGLPMRFASKPPVSIIPIVKMPVKTQPRVEKTIKIQLPAVRAINMPRVNPLPRVTHPTVNVKPQKSDTAVPAPVVDLKAELRSEVAKTLPSDENRGPNSGLEGGDVLQSKKGSRGREETEALIPAKIDLDMSLPSVDISGASKKLGEATVEVQGMMDKTRGNLATVYSNLAEQGQGTALRLEEETQKLTSNANQVAEVVKDRGSDLQGAVRVASGRLSKVSQTAAATVKASVGGLADKLPTVQAKLSVFSSEVSKSSSRVVSSVAERISGVSGSVAESLPAQMERLSSLASQVKRAAMSSTERVTGGGSGMGNRLAALGGSIRAVLNSSGGGAGRGLSVSNEVTDAELVAAAGVGAVTVAVGLGVNGTKGRNAGENEQLERPPLQPIGLRKGQRDVPKEIDAISATSSLWGMIRDSGTEAGDAVRGVAQ